jgi:hypothetical protein
MLRALQDVGASGSVRATTPAVKPRGRRDDATAVARALPKLLSLFSALAVLVCFAVAALWVRSCFAADAAMFTRETSTLTLQSAAGGLTLTRTPVGTEPRPAVMPSGRFSGTFTFGVWDTAEGGWAAALPHWVICAFGLLPAFWLKLRSKWHEYQSLPTGNCIKCGELLREVGMCPKCRTPAGGFIG